MKKFKNKYLLSLLVIIMIGAFLRFYHLGKLSFNADEFLDINSSYAYFQTGEWKNWDFNHQIINIENEFAPRDERAWGYKIQVANLFNFFPPTEGVARSISALWGVLTILLLYFTAIYFTEKKSIGLLSAFLFAVSIVGIEFDRTLRMYAMFFPLFLFFSILFFKFFEGKYQGKIRLLRYFNQRWGLDLRYLVPAGLVGLLSLHIHQLTANFVFIFGTYVAVGAVYLWIKTKSLNNKYALSLFLLVAIFAAGMLFFSSTLKQYSAGIGFFENHYSYFSEVLTDYKQPLLAIILFILGGYYLFKKRGRKKEAIWLLLSFLVTLFSAVFLWTRNVGPQYIFFVQSFEIILIAIGIYEVANFFHIKLGGEFGKKAFWVPIILLLLILPNYGYFFEKNNTYRQNSTASNPNYRNVFNYVKKNSNKGDVLITRNFRSYYYAGAGLKVYNFGGERNNEKVTAEMIQDIIVKNSQGWVVFSDNDEVFLTKEAREYLDENLEKINTIAVRGAISVYRWR